jgi:putative protease
MKEATKKEKPIGEITHYYDKIEVGIIKMKDKLEVGDKIHIKGNATDFEQDVESMQIEHEQVNKVKKGDMIGIQVKDKVREGDLVYKVE